MSSRADVRDLIQCAYRDFSLTPFIRNDNVINNMNLQIKAKNIELTEEIKDYAQKKMDALDKYLGDFPVINADFQVEKTTNHHQKGEVYRAELNLKVPQELLRVEKTGTDIHQAIDLVRDHMEIVINKYREKRKGL